MNQAVRCAAGIGNSPITLGMLPFLVLIRTSDALSDGSVLSMCHAVVQVTDG